MCLDDGSPGLRRQRHGSFIRIAIYLALVALAMSPKTDTGPASGPRSLMRRLRRWTRWPPVGRVDFGDLRRQSPISEVWGSDRGEPIDRYYIRGFLERRASDIAGHVLEVGTDRYTRLLGGDHVRELDVLHVAERNPGVTMIGNLETGEGLVAEAFDCVILTQTLNVLFDVAAALRSAERILRPGGVLLVTVPGISKISRYDMDRWGHHWSFTTASMRRLLSGAFPSSSIDIEAHGNVLAAIAFLHGLSSDELSAEELGHADRDFEVLIGARVRKSGTG